MAFVLLDNASERVEISLYSEQYNEYSSLLQNDKVLIAQGEISSDEYSGGCQLRADNIYDVAQLRSTFLVSLEIDMAEDAIDSTKIKLLQDSLKQNEGGSSAIIIRYQRIKGEAGLLKLGDEWSVSVNRKLIEILGENFGAENVSFNYDIGKIRQGSRILQEENVQQLAMSR